MAEIGFTALKRRLTENGVDRRVTEDGSFRFLQAPNAGKGSLSQADLALTQFDGSIQVKNNDTWQVPVISVFHLGSWRNPTSSYILDNGIWKRTT